MEEELIEIASKYNGKIISQESKWFNGNAYFPLYHHTIEFEKKKIWFKIECEYRQSDFSRKRSVMFNAFPTESCTIQIHATFEVDTQKPTYKIDATNFITKLFRRNNRNGLDIHSKNENLKKHLEESQILQEIYLPENHKYYSKPSIKGKMVKKNNHSSYAQTTVYMIHEDYLKIIDDTIGMMAETAVFLRKEY